MILVHFHPIGYFRLGAEALEAPLQAIGEYRQSLAAWAALPAADPLKAKLAEFGMVFVGGWYSTELLLRSAKEEFEAAQEHLALTRGAGANILIAAET